MDTPWLCGYKENNLEHQNVNTGEYPFVKECECCHKRPKAYQCHHCKELIYLSRDRDNQNFAKRLGDIESIIDLRAEKIANQKEEIQNKAHEYELAKVDKKIELEKQRGQEPENSVKNEILNIFKKRMDQQFTIEDVQDRKSTRLNSS